MSIGLMTVRRMPFIVIHPMFLFVKYTFEGVVYLKHIFIFLDKIDKIDKIMLIKSITINLHTYM